MAYSALGFVAFLLAINSALAITCYKCDSSKGMTCSYGLFSFSYATEDCNAQEGGLGVLSSIIPQKCYKLVGEDKEGNEFVSRGCVVSTGPINSCQAIAKAAQFMSPDTLNKLECFTCDTDKCNSASKFTGMTMVALALASFVFFF